MTATLSTVFPEIIIIKPRIFKDGRGNFFETYNRKRYKERRIDVDFVQDNCSTSVKNVLRGLHYQIRSPQGKLVYVLEGKIFDVAADIRQSSPNFGKFFSMTISSEDYTQIYIPPGFAHGFFVLSEYTRVYYKCTNLYDPEGERGIIWNDPFINIPWPSSNPILSEKDSGYPTLDQISPDDLFP